MSTSSSATPPPAGALFASSTTGLVRPEKFAFLVDMPPQLVWITDRTGFHTCFNQRRTDFTGYTLADSVGADMWNHLLHPDGQARARTVWGHSLDTGATYGIEYRFKARNSLCRWFGTNTDVTAMYELQECNGV